MLVGYKYVSTIMGKLLLWNLAGGLFTLYLAFVLKLSDEFYYYLNVFFSRAIFIFYKNKIDKLYKLRNVLINKVDKINDKYVNFHIEEHYQKKQTKLRKLEAETKIDVDWIDQALGFISSIQSPGRMGRSYIDEYDESIKEIKKFS